MHVRLSAFLLDKRDNALNVYMAHCLCMVLSGCGRAEEGHWTEGDLTRLNRRLRWPGSSTGLAARPSHSGSPCSTGLSPRRNSLWLCRASFCLCRTRVSALHQWSAEPPSICWQCAGTRAVRWVRYAPEGRVLSSMGMILGVCSCPRQRRKA